jgi:hypothetical protein
LAPTLPPAFGAYCKKTNGTAPDSSHKNIRIAYSGILKDFIDSIPKNSSGQSELFARSVRLAWHDAGEVDINSENQLGSDGCLSFSSDNAGLIEPSSIPSTVLEPIWQKYCDKISRADFWVLFAKLSAEKADPTKTLSIKFEFGRKDNLYCNLGYGRLPSAQKGLGEIERIFVTQMGLTMDDGVTLLGAHSLGHVHPYFSGYGLPTNHSDINNNAWDSTPAILDNLYYSEIINKVFNNDFQ